MLNTNVINDVANCDSHTKDDHYTAYLACIQSLVELRATVNEFNSNTITERSIA